jgi:quercetin dioxygenase-like cupin family protein
MRLPRTRISAALATLGMLAAFGAGVVIAQSSDPPAAKRSALAQSTEVKGAQNRTLGLSKVVIPVGAQLALHHHEGTQVAYIQRGVLSYTVEEGSVDVRRGPADGDNELVRKIRAGQTGKIRAGHWIVEQPSDIHRAANRGSSKIVIFLSTLLRTGAPPSTPD